MILPSHSSGFKDKANDDNINIIVENINIHCVILNPDILKSVKN